MNARRIAITALVLLASAVRAEAEAPPTLDQRAIFEILCGGAPAANQQLHDHLWQVAGSLAAKRWTPPQVTVRFAVQPARR